MNTVIGRCLGVMIAGATLALGLWTVNNTTGWTVGAGIIITIFGALLLGGVSTTIGKDFERWDESA